MSKKRATQRFLTSLLSRLVLAGKRTAFEQYEAQLYEELVALIGETGILHTALDSLLKLEIDTYKRALDPISSTTARLEQLSTSSAGSPAAVSTPGSSLAGGIGNAPSYGSQYGSQSSKLLAYIESTHRVSK